EYVKQAFADITDFTEFGYDEYPFKDINGEEVIDEGTGEVKTYKVSNVSLKDSNEVDGTLIQEVKKGKDGVSVKLYDKQKAM
ncbi:terminase small subunit, partial [Klebsiella pneumoniae]